jgi:hypothetical protein
LGNIQQRYCLCEEDKWSIPEGIGCTFQAEEGSIVQAGWFTGWLAYCDKLLMQIKINPFRDGYLQL